mgnify:CR=1 FL=1
MIPTKLLNVPIKLPTQLSVGNKLKNCFQLPKKTNDNNSNLIKKMKDFFSKNPVENNKDLSFFINNEIIIDVTIQKNAKTNTHEHCIYFNNTQKGIASYKKIAKKINPNNTNLKLEFKPALGIIRIYYDVVLKEINGKNYLPLHTNTFPLLLTSPVDK